MHVINPTINEESFASLASLWSEARYNLNWGSIFMLPAWLHVWWDSFGSAAELYLRAVRQKEQAIGIAPLYIKDDTVSFVGSADVCDYLDFIVADGMAKDFFSVLLDDLASKNIRQLNLEALRPDSVALTKLVPLAEKRGYEVASRQMDVSIEMDLPSSWDEYLAELSKKQRHEVRRKLRRLWEVGGVEYRFIEAGQEAGDLTDTFLKLFSLSHEDKAGFMTDRMKIFFKLLAEAMAEIGLLRFGVLEMDKQIMAMIMGFDYDDTMYLYNNVYASQYNTLSVGLLSKVLCLKESIHMGKKKWDFLRGREPYKYHLGGSEIPVYHCHIRIG